MTRLISIALPDALHEQLNQAALRLEQSSTWIIRRALERYLEDDEMRHQMTLTGLADVDAGRTIDDAAMDEWTTNIFGPEPVLGQDGVEPDAGN